AVASVILLIIAIVLYTNLKDAQDSKKEAENTLHTYVTSAQQNSPEVKKYMSGSSSVVGQLISDNTQLKKIIGVNKDTDTKAITKKIADAKVSGSLLSGITQLHSEISSLKSQLKQAKSARKDAEAKQASLQKRMSQLASQYKKST